MLTPAYFTFPLPPVLGGGEGALPVLPGCCEVVVVVVVVLGTLGFDVVVVVVVVVRRVVGACDDDAAVAVWDVSVLLSVPSIQTRD
jgi:hypothetical protein